MKFIRAAGANYLSSLAVCITKRSSCEEFTYRALPLPPCNKPMIQTFWEIRRKCSGLLVLCALICFSQLECRHVKYDDSPPKRLSCSKQNHISVTPLCVNFSVSRVLDTPDAAKTKAEALWQNVEITQTHQTILSGFKIPSLPFSFAISSHLNEEHKGEKDLV